MVHLPVWRIIFVEIPLHSVLKIYCSQYTDLILSGGNIFDKCR